MHTEEDTFNRLRRLSFDGLLQLVVPHCMVGESVALKAEELDVLRPNGWTKHDFIGEFNAANDEIITYAYTNYR